MSQDGFLSEWLQTEPSPNLEKSVIRHDKWDAAQYEGLIEEMAEMGVAEDALAEAAPGHGGTLFADVFYDLVKANPKLRDPNEVRPSYMLNRTVMEEERALTEREEARNYSVGDEIGAALACIAMEPELEIILDRLKQEQKMADELRKLEDDLADLEGQQRSLDEMWNDLMSDDGEPSEEEIANYQTQAANLATQSEALRILIEQGADKLEQELEKHRAAIRGGMRNALQKANKDVSDVADLAQSWGLERGRLLRLPSAERMALAKRLNNDRIRKISEKMGHIERMAFTEQSRKTDHARDEVYNVSMGNDLARLLPMEYALLSDDIQQYVFYKKFVEQELLQYELRGEERVAKGGLYWCEDGSGSMGGEKEIWAKAVALCFLHVARAQKRSFYGIHFGSVGEIATYDFRKIEEVTFEKVLDFAEVFFNGGTDFVTPLSHAVELLRAEYDATGAVRGDIILCTDGICAVPDGWLKKFQEEKARLGFRVWGIMIGGSRRDEPLATICDGRVFVIKDFRSGEPLRPIFRSV